MHQRGLMSSLNFVEQHSQRREECLARPVGCTDIAGQRLNDLGQIAFGRPLDLSVCIHDRSPGRVCFSSVSRRGNGEIDIHLKKLSTTTAASSEFGPAGSLPAAWPRAKARGQNLRAKI